MKNMSEISYDNLQLSYHEIASILEKTAYQELQQQQQKEKEKKEIGDTFLFKVFSKSNIQVTPKIMEH